MTRKKADIWVFYEDFFPDAKTKRRGKCKVCGEIVKLSNSTGNANAHIAHHKEDPEAAAKLKEVLDVLLYISLS